VARELRRCDMYAPSRSSTIGQTKLPANARTTSLTARASLSISRPRWETKWPRRTPRPRAPRPVRYWLGIDVPLDPAASTAFLLPLVPPPMAAFRCQLRGGRFHGSRRPPPPLLCDCDPEIVSTSVAPFLDQSRSTGRSTDRTPNVMHPPLRDRRPTDPAYGARGTHVRSDEIAPDLCRRVRGSGAVPRTHPDRRAIRGGGSRSAGAPSPPGSRATPA